MRDGPREARDTPAAAPDLTIIVCTHNRAHLLSALLANLVAQIAATPVDLIVVDSASRPTEAAAVRALVAAAPRARLLRLEQPGLSAARNAGLRAARTEWVAFLDDDEVPTSGWVSAARGLLGRLPEDCAACGGNVLPIYQGAPPARMGGRWLNYLSTIDQEGEFDQTDAPKFGGGHALLRRRAVLKADCFDRRLGRVSDNLLSGEDVHLVRKLTAAGWRIWHSDRIEVGHLIDPGRLTYGWVRRRAYWEGVTRASLLGLDDPVRLHAKCVVVALKLPPLLALVAVARTRWEMDLRLAFAMGFIAGYFGRLSRSA